MGWNNVEQQGDNLNVRVEKLTSFDYMGGTGNIEPTDERLEFAPIITTRKFKAQIKLTTQQYNAIVNNRNGYITLNYRSEQYRGYLNNLALDLGVNMRAEIELLEKYEV